MKNGYILLVSVGCYSLISDMKDDIRASCIVESSSSYERCIDDKDKFLGRVALNVVGYMSLAGLCFSTAAMCASLVRKEEKGLENKLKE